MADAWKGPGAGNQDTYTPDNLIAGDFPLRSETRTFAAGQTIVRGTVLGLTSAEYGEWKTAASGSSDGSETPAGIAVHDIDTTDGAKEGGVYISGEFNERAVTLGAGITLEAAKIALRDRSIFLKPSVANPA
jgi:hypothetical protein